MADPVANPFAAKKVAARARSRAGVGDPHELRQKCDWLEAENAKLKKRVRHSSRAALRDSIHPLHQKNLLRMLSQVNDLRKATAATTRVVKAATVPQEKTNNLPPIKGAEEAPDEPAEDVALLHTQIAELRQKLEDSEDARRIDRENLKWELQTKNQRIRELEDEVKSLMMHAQRQMQAAPQPVPPSQPDNDWLREREALMVKLAQATQSAAACAHVAKAAQDDRQRDMETIKKLREQLREFKLAKAKAELDAEMEKPSQQSVTMVLRNGRWFGARNTGSGASESTQPRMQAGPFSPQEPHGIRPGSPGNAGNAGRSDVGFLQGGLGGVASMMGSIPPGGRISITRLPGSGTNGSAPRGGPFAAFPSPRGAS